uniref:Methyltransferase FkbM domain-containing protein n=1 Tax=Chromera velia CCMP2878 TaxID=1169474 RepID=A0A0G4H4T4_9ALVE|eukprot:Cvel_24679.t1-p1 / transcript=Cvel_24679.t1 / gene=Cvel_24679 / organism=Chromera_velia_CCMP2878 / gene_product=hypothetical protein / transcript_product=hypothetical protein / location=Cvel_scaffold2703:389-1456(-) / protein_length=356 / sequence_SO=supercontig / SO=protein_coding / is_pseudo=false
MLLSMFLFVALRLERKDQAVNVSAYVPSPADLSLEGCAALLSYYGSSGPNNTEVVVVEHNPFFNMAVWKEGDLISREIQQTKQLGEQGMPLDGDEVLIDVGANVGWYTLKAASEGHRVFAFEPMPQNYELVHWSLCKNGFTHVKLFNVALGSKEQSCWMESAYDNFGNGVVRCKNERDSGGVMQEREHFERASHIKALRFDSLLPALGLDALGSRPLTLKVDIEGSEVGFFEGAQRFFSGPNAPTLIQLEVNERFLIQKGKSAQLLLQKLSTVNNYDIYINQCAKIPKGLIFGSKRRFWAFLKKHGVPEYPGQFDVVAILRTWSDHFMWLSNIYCGFSSVKYLPSYRHLESCNQLQ